MKSIKLIAFIMVVIALCVLVVNFVPARAFTSEGATCNSLMAKGHQS